MTATDRVRKLYDDGLNAFRHGDQDLSRALNEQALELARELDDSVGESLALVGLSRVAFREGDYERVKGLAQEALSIARRSGDQADERAPIHMLAAGTRLSGDYDTARELYLENLQLNRLLDIRTSVAMELHNLGHVELHRGDLAAAERFFAELSELQDMTKPYDRAMSKLNMAAIAVAHGERDQALPLLDECEAILAAEGIALDPDDRFEVETLKAQL